MQNPLYKLAQLTSEHLRKMDCSKVIDHKLSHLFADDLDNVSVCVLHEKTPGERRVRALSYAPLVLGQSVSVELAELYNAARNAFGQVRWTEFYEADSWSKSFLPSFANGEGIGPDGRLQHDEIILGLFLLGPNTVYPEHAHPAEEFYLVLTGNPEFNVGGKGFEFHEAGSVVLHHSNVSHAIRTSDEPFYAIYGWRGEIGARSWYRDNMAEISESKKYPTIKKV